MFIVHLIFTQIKTPLTFPNFLQGIFRVWALQLKCGVYRGQEYFLNLAESFYWAIYHDLVPSCIQGYVEKKECYSIKALLGYIKHSFTQV